MITRDTATALQLKALEEIEALSEKHFQGPLVGVVNGPAGTGKTSMLLLVQQALGDSIIVTPTGKAAVRVAEATHCHAQTFHKWAYKARKNDLTGETEFIPKLADELERPDSGVVIWDEGSMMDEKMFTDTLQACDLLECNLVVLGDSFQLPPVNAGFNILQASAFNPTFRVDLNEILRQAADSYIIRASELVRRNKMIEALDILPNVLSSKLLDACDDTLSKGGAIICHTNRMRHRLNRQLRARRGFRPDTIESGEPILVLRNNYQVDLFNGEISTFQHWIHGPRGPYDVVDGYRKKDGKYYFGRAEVGREKGAGQEVVMCRDELAGNIPDDGVGMGSVAYTGRKEFGKASPYLHANYGYTLTCHKSQGSEWPEVLVVIEPTTNISSHEGRRWLYTAITRAKKEVRLCMAPALES